MTFGIWLLRKLWTVVKGRQQLLFACLLHLSVCVSKKIHSVLEVIQIFVIFFKNLIQTDYLSFWQGVSNDKSLLENYINKEHSHKHAYRYAMEFSPLVRYICVIHVFICLYFAELNRAFAELMLYSRGWHFYLWVPFTQ